MILECGVCGRRIYSSDTEYRARLGVLWINFLANGVGSTRLLDYGRNYIYSYRPRKGVGHPDQDHQAILSTRQLSSLESIFPQK